jgi:hypothetical protein
MHQLGDSLVDLICGRQVTTRSDCARLPHAIFSQRLNDPTTGLHTMR